jgi:hypothetical protein
MTALRAAAAAAIDANASMGLTDRFPSTPHLPFSPEVCDDDTQASSEQVVSLLAHEVVVTEKLDGGNCCLMQGKVYGILLVSLSYTQ